MHATTTRRTRARRVAATVAAAALALTLAACGDDNSSTESKPNATTSASADPSADPSAAPTAAATASAEDIAALESVKVEGKPGTQPTITLPEKPFTVSANVARVVDEGSGDAIAEGDLIELGLTAVDGSDGKILGSTHDGEATGTWTVGAALPVLDDLLTTVKFGAQILMALPQDTTTVYVVEPLRVIPLRAEGKAVAPKDGLPTVKLGDDGAPTITPATGDAPTELVVQPLIEGTGKTVEAGDNVLVQYSGVLWDGTAFDSSWGEGRTPFTVANVGQAQVIDGWNEGLVGQKVGSQVLLVVPPAKGYGDKEQGTIPPNSTLVFVVDILFA